MEEIQKLQEIKILLKSGQITYDYAKVMAGPYIEKVNQKIITISKKFKKTPSLVSFSSFMR
jgi:hypothetical protein